MEPSTTIRSDLGVVELDGDLVVYDPVAATSHVIQGSGVLIWNVLRASHVEGLGRRVAEQVGLAESQIAHDVDAFVTQLHRLGLLTESTVEPSAEAGP